MVDKVIEYIHEQVLAEMPISSAHATIERTLNVEAAAAKLSAWTDKQRGNRIREWEWLDAPTRQMYRLLIYDIVFALGDDSETM